MYHFLNVHYILSKWWNSQLGTQTQNPISFEILKFTSNLMLWPTSASFAWLNTLVIVTWNTGLHQTIQESGTELEMVLWDFILGDSISDLKCKECEQHMDSEKAKCKTELQCIRCGGRAGNMDLLFYFHFLHP